MSALYKRMSRWIRPAAWLLALLLALAPAAAAEADVSAAQTEAEVSEAGAMELDAAANAAYVSAKHLLNLGSDTTCTVYISDTLDIAFKSGGFKSFASKKPSVADIIDADSASGTARIVALRAGEAKLKARLNSGRKIRLKLIVKDPSLPEKVTLPQGPLTLNVGDTLALEPVLTPATAITNFRWSSSKKKYASVSPDGVVTGVREGKAKITVKTTNGKKASVTVRVIDAYKPDSVRLEDAAVSVGSVVSLVPTLTPATAVTQYTWHSSEKKVATVTEDGLVLGIKPGKTKITVRTANGKKATCTVTVQAAPVTGVRCRALLVANDAFYLGDDLGWETGSMNASAANALKNALKGVTGSEGDRYSVAVKKNLTRQALQSAIEQTFADADEDDVSLFYFASHGDSLSTSSDAGALAMASVTEEEPEYVPLSVLRDWLLRVPGQVIVLLDTCGSGAAVYKKGDGNSDAARRACEDFDEAVAHTFSESDPGVYVNGAASNTGELRQANKFYVLCSSRYREDSWAYDGDDVSGSYFTDWLVEGMGQTGQMPADQQFSGNRDGAVDLYELYKYISGVGDNFAITFYGSDFYQHVQVYPANTRYVLFR